MPGTSQVDISGGTVFDLTADAYSQVAMTDGQINYLLAVGNSVVDVTGGSVGYIRVDEDASVNVSNAYIQDGIFSPLCQNASLSLTNTTLGQPWDALAMYESSHFTLGAGTSFGYAMSYMNSTVDIAGRLAVYGGSSR